MWSLTYEPLTERDTLALLLAHAWIRARGGSGPSFRDADFPLGMAIDALDLGSSYCDALRDAVVHCSQWSNRKRAVRARLAMFLRAWYRLEMEGEELRKKKFKPLWMKAPRNVE